MMCRCLKVSRSGYYAWLGREPSRTVRRRKELSALIEWVFNSSRGTYGYRRTHAALARRGVETSPDTVRSIMRSQGPPGRTATPKGPGAPGPAAGTGARAPTWSGAGSRRQPAGRAGGRATPTRISAPGEYPHPGRRARSTWQPSPAAARRKQSGTRLGRQHAAPVLMCEAIDMAARRCPYTTGKTILLPRAGAASTPPPSSPGTWRATALAPR